MSYIDMKQWVGDTTHQQLLKKWRHEEPFMLKVTNISYGQYRFVVYKKDNSIEIEIVQDRNDGTTARVRLLPTEIDQFIKKLRRIQFDLGLQ